MPPKKPSRRFSALLLISSMTSLPSYDTATADAILASLSPAEIEFWRAREMEMAGLLDPVCGLLWGDKPGHTAEIRDLPRVHDGRATAQWLSLRYLLFGEQPADLPALLAVTGLQVTDKSEPTYGCSRWYGEEKKVNDTNGGFFLSHALIICWHSRRDQLTPATRHLLITYFTHAAVWFKHECQSPSLFYPNKIISDGSAALALAFHPGRRRPQAKLGMRPGLPWTGGMALTYQGALGWRRPG